MQQQFVLLCFLFVSQFAWATMVTPIAAPTVKAPKGCVGVFQPGLQVIAYNSSLSLDTKDVAHFKFASGFNFSPDGKFVLLSHTLTAGSERTTVLTTDSLKKVGGSLFENSGFGFADIRNSDVNSKQNTLVSLTTSSHNSKDSVITWSLKDNKVKDIYELPKVQDSDFVYYKSSHASYGARLTTKVSAEHPYFIRFYSDLYSRAPKDLPWQQRDALQIINKDTKQVLNLRGLHTSSEFFNEKPFNAKFEFLAQLASDKKTLVIQSFKKLEQMFNQQNWLDNTKLTPVVQVVRPPQTRLEKLKQLFWFEKKVRKSQAEIGFAPKLINNKFRLEPNKSFIHQEPVLEYTVVPWAPVVITRTKSSLNVWDVRTGELKAIEGQITGHRIFNNSKILAYTTADGSLNLFSIARGTKVGRVPSFSDLRLKSYIMNWSKDQLLIINDKGEVYNSVERYNPDGRGGRHYLGQSQLKLPKKVNSPLFSTIIVNNEVYVLQMYTSVGNTSKKGSSLNDIQIIVDVYKGQNNQVMQSFKYKMHDFMPQFKLSPNGEKLFFTSSELEATVLDLPALIKAHNL